MSTLTLYLGAGSIICSMDGPDKKLLIGELARQAGLNITAVRFYERRGLLPDVERASSGYRLYPPVAVDRLLFIQRAKSLGFSLDEIAELLSLNQNPATCCQDVRDKAAAKMADIEHKLAQLQRIHAALNELVQQCPGDGPSSTCPILTALNDDAEH